MSLYATDDEAVTHEVAVSTLRIGQHFELYLSYRINEGTVLGKDSGGVDVYDFEEKRRTIVTSDGVEKEVVSHGQRTRYALSTPVVPLDKVSDTAQFNSHKGETQMAKAERKEKKQREPKKLIITRYYVVASKQDTEKGKKLQDKENTGHNAVLYRAILKKDGMTFEEIREAVGKKDFGSNSKNVDSIMRWHLQDLRKKGFVKSTDAKEEVDTPAAAS